MKMMMKQMKKTRRPSTVLGIVPILAASVVWVAGTAMAQDQQSAWQEKGEEKAQETRQETTRTVRRYEETTTIVGRGVTGDVWRPPANELSPEITKADQLWYKLSQPGPS
jgi:hypothetical protein